LAGYDWIIGLGLIFGLAFMITILLDGNGKVFFIFLTVLSAIMVYAAMLDLWVFIVSFIITLVFIISDFTAGNRGFKK